MTPKQLRAVRTFFIENDKAIDDIVTRTFSEFFTLAPCAADLFRDGLQNHRDAFTRMLRRIIDLTRTASLWPVSVHSGQAAIPGFADLRQRHIGIGVTDAHVETMKRAMLQALEKTCPDSFTNSVAEAFDQFYDILGNSLTSQRWSGSTSDDELQDLLAREGGAPATNFHAFFADRPGNAPKNT